MFDNMLLFKRYTVLVLLTLALLASGARSINLYPRPALAVVASEASDQLSPSERVEVFDEVWQTINENYYDAKFNGVNWQAVRERYRPLIDRESTDQGFYDLVKRIV